MNPLIELKNGDWIRPSEVQSIRKAPLEHCSITDHLYPARYIIAHRDGMMSIVECSDQEQCDEQVRALAEQINTTCTP